MNFYLLNYTDMAYITCIYEIYCGTVSTPISAKSFWHWGYTNAYKVWVNAVKYVQIIIMQPMFKPQHPFNTMKIIRSNIETFIACHCYYRKPSLLVQHLQAIWFRRKTLTQSGNYRIFFFGMLRFGTLDYPLETICDMMHPGCLDFAEKQ